MPIYEYECDKCGHEFEREQRMSDPPVKTCPSCKARRVTKLISRSSFVLKGGGWYQDGYADAKKGAKKDEGSKDATTSSDSESKSDKGSDKKADKGKDAGPSTTKSKKGKGGGKKSAA
jgi:putative FmdB family regulatory protein